MQKHFDVLNLYSKFTLSTARSIFDPSAPEAFIAHTREAIEASLADPSLLHGQRTQNMFEAMVVSLGHFEMIKVEDTGRFHTRINCRAPDFRIILKDGPQYLVEVKSVYLPNAVRQRKPLMSRADLQSLQNYAAAVSCPLKIAIYWARRVAGRLSHLSVQPIQRA